jgi:hypothetical protein
MPREALFHHCENESQRLSIIGKSVGADLHSAQCASQSRRWGSSVAEGVQDFV